MNDNATISLTGDNGEIVTFDIIEHTTIMGREYILVADKEDEDTVYLMRKLEDDGTSEEVSYSFVDDENEMDSVSKVFAELLEDTDLISED